MLALAFYEVLLYLSFQKYTIFFYMYSVYESYGSIFCLISSLHPARRYILLRDLHQAPPSIQNSILAFCHQKWKRPASLVVPIHEISIREKG